MNQPLCMYSKHVYVLPAQDLFTLQMEYKMLRCLQY